MTRFYASSPSRVAEPSAIVIGAGPTGLYAAFHLGDEGLLLEQHERVGGWSRSLEQGGFTFDYAGHILFSDDRYVLELYQKRCERPSSPHGYASTDPRYFGG